MRVLMIKMSSLGDVIHSLPALSDAAKVFPGIHFDWVVEENFAAIPKLHSHVKRIIPVAARRWRKDWFRFERLREVNAFIKNLRLDNYDYVIDAQGLMKSAVVSLFSRGKKAGFSSASAREPWSSLFYHKHSVVSQSIHAILRIRQLFAGTFGYDFPHDEPNYGITHSHLPLYSFHQPYVVFLHGTTWGNKHWPVESWIALGQKLSDKGLDIHLLWGNAVEKARAEKIKAALPHAIICPKLKLEEAASVLANARAVVSVDTGLGHLAAALDIPTLGLFGPTDPLKSGIQGKNQENLYSELGCIPCFKRECRLLSDQTQDAPCLVSLSPERVWGRLQDVLKERSIRKEKG